MDLSFRFGIPTSRKSTWRLGRVQACLMYRTWARFGSSGTGFAWLESLATQRITSIAPPRCAYTHFLDSDGCLIDDMIFAVVSEREILGVPNASMIDVMWSWFTQHLPQDGSVTMENISDETSIMALQGPNARGSSTPHWEAANTWADSSGVR